MADTKTYLKVPYRDGVIRALPFNGGHLTALTMAKQFRDPARQLNAMLRVLNRLIGDDTYEQITDDLVDGEISIPDVTTLLEEVVKATAAYHKAQAAGDLPGEEDHDVAPAGPGIDPAPVVSGE